MKIIIPLNPYRDGTCRTIKAQYHQTSRANFVRQDGLGTTGVMEVYEEGDHTYTILDEIVDLYDNLYYRDDPTKVRAGVPPHYGFHTNKATKRNLNPYVNCLHTQVGARDNMEVYVVEIYEQQTTDEDAPRGENPL